MDESLSARRAAILEQVREYAQLSLAAREFERGESSVPVSGKVLEGRTSPRSSTHLWTGG